MAIDLDVVIRLNKASAREAAREAQNQFKGTGEDIGNELGTGIARGIDAKGPEIEKALKKVADASGKVLVEQQKLEDLKKQSNVTDTQKITQSERLAKALRAEEQAISDVNRALDDHNSKNDTAVTKTRNLGEEAQKAASKIGDLGSSLKGLGAVGAIGGLPAIATGIAEVAGALQQLSGAAFAGPGIFAGIAASAGTAALGAQGMSDAFTASIKAMDGTKASVEAANKALAELSPNAAEAVKTVVGLKGTFTELRDISATNIFEGFSTNLKNLVSADLPVVTRGIDSISRALGQNLTQAMSSLGSGSTQGFLDRILGNTGNAQGRLTAAIDPIVHAVGVLSAAGSDTLPQLATAIGSVADRFNQFITQADANGNLKKWIDDGIKGLGQLGETALNIGKTFTAITQAAGTGGLLTTLQSATGSLQTFLNSSQGQADLRKYFAEGRDMLSQLLDTAKSAGPVLAGMFQAASSATRAWLPVIKQVLDIINSIPGGAQAVVGAFVAWKSIQGVAGLITSLTTVTNLLKVALPAAAAEGAGGITAALAAVSVPAWLGYLVAGGAAAAVAPGVEKHISEGTNLPRSRVPRLNRDGTLDTKGTPYGAPPQTGPLPIAGADQYGSGVASRERRGAGITWAGNAPASAGFSTQGWSPVGTPTPGVSSYSSPVASGGGGGAASTPYIDPSKFQVGNPLAGMPAPSAQANQQDVFEADSRALTAAHNLEQGKLALAVLEQKGTATQAEILTAKNNLNEQERALYDAQFKDLQARQGQMTKASSDLQSIFAPLDQDFGVSGGIPGIVKNLVTFLGNMALGGAIAKSPALQAAAIQMQQSNQTGAAPVFAPGGQTGGGYPGDAALLSGVPSGQYQWGGANLAKGLADCSGAVGNLVNTLEGKDQGAGGKLNTGNAAQWLPAHGLIPNNTGANVPGAFNVGYNNEHMQATLPGGTNFNWGSDAAAQDRGINGGGAFDPAQGFDQHYYLPTGPAAMGPAPIGGGLGPAAAYPGAAPAPSWGNPAMPTGGGGEGPAFSKPAGGPGVGGAAGTSSLSQAATAGGGGGGITPGGTLDSALSGAAAAADMFAPGAGQAAQVGIKLASRAIQEGAQASAIGVSGLMETFLPHDSELGDPGKSWFGKIAGGISGARPATPNAAQKSAPPAPGTPASGEGAGPPPGPMVNIENMHTGGADGQGVGQDIARQQAASYSAGQPR